LPVERWTGDVDVVHVLDLDPPPARAPLVLTVHDVAAVERPSLHSRPAVALLRRQLARAGGAAAVVAVSRATADALVRHGLDGSRVHVTPLGATPLPAARRPAALPDLGDFVLAVGARHPRKALDLLLDALAGWPGAPPLVHAGPDAGAAPTLARRAERDGVTVHWLGPVADAELAWLYSHATVLGAPSHDEGFGLPVLEAMAAGCAVVASDLAAHREVVGGDGALLVPAGDVAALGAALRSVADDDARRAALVEAGRARAAGRTWDATADATVEVYRQVAR
jgi:glycosyltransferase involved in cell wall biosynthesis